MSKTRQTKIRSLTAEFSPGHCIDWHSHDWQQLAYATSGVMYLKTKNTNWFVPPQRAVWIPSGLDHQVTMHGTVKMRTLYFHPSMRVFAAKDCQAVNVSNLMRELIIHVCNCGILEPNSTENRSLLQLLVCRAKKMDVVPLMLPMPKDERAVRVANSLIEDPSQLLIDVATENGSSVRTLQRIFSAETGISLGRWRSRARLLTALRLLEEGQQVTQVSMQLGFESLSSFIYAFRTFFGMTPSKFFPK